MRPAQWTAAFVLLVRCARGLVEGLNTKALLGARGLWRGQDRSIKRGDPSGERSFSSLEGSMLLSFLLPSSCFLCFPSFSFSFPS